MTAGTLTGRLGEGLAVRWRRALPRRLSAPVAVVVGAGYVAALALSVLVLTGWRGPEQSVPFGGTYRPVQALATLAALGIVAVATALAAVRSTGWRRAALSVVVVLLTLVGLDPLPLGASRLPLLLASLAAAAAALALPVGGPAREAPRVLLASAPFVVGVVAQARVTDVDAAIGAARFAAFTPAAAIGLSALAVFAIASSVEDQRERAERLMTFRVTRRTVAVAVALKLALLAALYLRLTGDFLGGEAFWRPRLDRPLSWVHALVVGCLVATVAVRSVRRPLRPGGFTPRLAGLTVVLGVMQATALVALCLVAAVSAVAPTLDPTILFTAPNWVIDHVEVIQLVAGVAVLAAAALELWLTRTLTTGLWLWLVAGLWLVPALAGIALADPGTTAWAAPGQVDTVVTLAVLVALVARVGRGRDDTARVLLALVVVPTVVLHLPNLWPGDWTAGLVRVGVVAAAAVVLLLNPPPVAGDVRDIERSRSLAVAGQLAILLAYVYLLADDTLSRGLAGSTTIAWLWLAVPVAAVLCTRVASTVTDRLAATRPSPPSAPSA